MICEVTGWEGGVDIKEQRTVDPDRFAFDCSKAATMLGFKAEYDFKKGLQDMFSDEKVLFTNPRKDLELEGQ